MMNEQIATILAQLDKAKYYEAEQQKLRNDLQNALEQSVENLAHAYVLEPNDARTWISLKSAIERFMRAVWKRGGLAGATSEEAYKVHIGLGDTMIPEDILEDIMRITIQVAIDRPGEFSEITFQQQMQKS